MLAERAQAREAEAEFAATRRRRALVTAAVLLPSAFLLFRASMRMRAPAGDGTYHVGLLGAAMLFAAVALAGAAVFLLVRAMRGRPLNDRLLSALWLGPAGRWFIRGAIRRDGTTRPAGVAPAPVVPAAVVRAPAGRATTPAPPRTRSALPDDRLARIEDRLAAIEQALTRALRDSTRD